MPGEIIGMLKKFRSLRPRTLRSALRIVAEELGGELGARALLLAVPADRTVYAARPMDAALLENSLASLRLVSPAGLQLAVLDDRPETGAADPPAALESTEIPIRMGADLVGSLLLVHSPGSLPRGREAELAEILSLLLGPLASDSGLGVPARSESLKIELLESLGDERVMRALLIGMMERTKAEFCAFYSAAEGEHLAIAIDCRELSPRVPEIREKLRTAYRMFTNESREGGRSRERIFVRAREGNIGYLVGSSKIESYFLVPVSFDAKVRGVLFFGSVRREAFSREDIAAFRSLADEGGERSPIIFRVGGETEMLDRLLAALPQGGALVSADGRVICSNDAFRETLRIEGDVPDAIAEMANASPFNLQGVWEEFTVFKRNLLARELKGVCVPECFVSVDWITLDNLSEDASSLVLVRDVTAGREQAEEREELIATVAHELRTPLTALKSSLRIMAESAPAETAAARDAAVEVWRAGTPSERFLQTSLRTVDRLGRLVDSLIGMSAARRDERPFRPEEIDVGRFLEEATILFVDPMRKKGIRFGIAVDPGAASIVIDRDRMEQVIQNLLANSIKHSAEGDSITISVAPHRESETHVLPRPLWPHLAPLRFVDLCVRDTGSGIPVEVAERINPEAGFSEHPVRASRGLGLYIARRLVRLHGGSLVIDTEQGEGSAVHLHLPMNVETAFTVQRYRAAEHAVDEMMGRGLSPVLYCMKTDGSISWEDVSRGWRVSAAVQPGPGASPERELLLWPLDGRLSIAVASRGGLGGDPASIFSDAAPGADPDASLTAGAPAAAGASAPAGRDRGSIAVGWASAPRDGVTFRELISVSIERMTREPLSIIRKGATAWQGTES